MRHFHIVPKHLKLIAVAVMAAFFAQFIPASALASCPNDSSYNDDERSCRTTCACGSLPETCGCCSTNCYTHGWNSSSSGSSSGSSNSSSPPSRPSGGGGGDGGGFVITGPILAVMLGIALAAAIVIWETEKSSKNSSDTSSPSIGPARGLGFSF